MKWRKSSYSTANGGECVEVAQVPDAGRVVARDSKHPMGSHLEYSVAEWGRLLADIRLARYDLWSRTRRSESSPGVHVWADMSRVMG